MHGKLQKHGGERRVKYRYHLLRIWVVVKMSISGITKNPRLLELTHSGKTHVTPRYRDPTCPAWAGGCLADIINESGQRGEGWDKSDEDWGKGWQRVSRHYTRVTINKSQERDRPLLLTLFGAHVMYSTIARPPRSQRYPHPTPSKKSPGPKVDPERITQRWRKKFSEQTYSVPESQYTVSQRKNFIFHTSIFNKLGICYWKKNWYQYLKP